MGLEKFEKHFRELPEDPKDHAKKMDEMGRELSQESEKLDKQSEAAEKHLREDVDPKRVEMCVSMIRMLEKMSMDKEKNELLGSFERTQNEPTLAEIHRRLAEETEDDDSQQ